MAADEKKAERPIDYDRLIKTMLRDYYPDLAEWLVGKRPARVRALDSVLPTTAVRLADKLLLLEFPGERPLVIHVEFQSGSDPAMPRRMAQYFSLTLEIIQRPGLEGAEFGCFVVYLNERRFKTDPGRLSIHGDFASMTFRYTVVKLWELSPGPFLEMSSPGLCPLVPLMAGNPVELVLQSRQKIDDAPALSEEKKRDLLGVLAGLSNSVIEERSFLHKLLSEIRAMGENYIFDLLRDEGEALGLAKGEALGLAKGRLKEARRSLSKVLETRFGPLPDDLAMRIEKLDEIERLETLIGEAAICPDLNTFLESLS